MSDPVEARREPSFQLTGWGAPPGDLDLADLLGRGATLVGRLLDLDRTVATFADDLAADIAAADRRLRGFLDEVDRYLEGQGGGAAMPPGGRPRSVRPPTPPVRLDLRAAGIETIIVAAGYRPHHPWLDLPIVDAGGRIRQRRGRTAAPGVYVVGQRFQHRRDSAFIDGARRDAADVVGHLLGGRAGADVELVS